MKLSKPLNVFLLVNPGNCCTKFCVITNGPNIQLTLKLSVPLRGEFLTKPGDSLLRATCRRPQSSHQFFW